MYVPSKKRYFFKNPREQIKVMTVLIQKRLMLCSFLSLEKQTLKNVVPSLVELKRVFSLERSRRENQLLHRSCYFLPAALN